MATITTYSDIATLDVALDKKTALTGVVASPAHNKFKKTQREIDTKRVWTREIINTQKDTLGAAISDTTGTTVTVTGPTSTNPVKYDYGFCLIMVDTEIMEVTGGNAAQTSLTVTRGAYGTTAATHSNGAAVAIIPINQIGSGKKGTNDNTFASREFNFCQNFQFELPMATPVRDGRMKSFTSIQESSPKWQKKKLAVRARKILEHSIFYGQRFQHGSAAVSTASLTLTGDGGKNMTGGWQYYIAQHGGRNTSASSSPPTMLMIQSDIGVMGENGAFDDIEATEFGEAECFLFATRRQIDAIQRLAWGNLMLTENMESKTLGVHVTRLRVGGTIVDLVASSGPLSTEYFLIPNREDLTEQTIYRFLEDVPLNFDADNTTDVPTVTWSNKVSEGYVMTRRHTLAAPASI